ncbi:MAG: LemA family protein [Candidatus Nealsonbacteria bacterium]|nr:LemA family protein [Candidatus Nealsonbacteria bacterium]
MKRITLTSTIAGLAIICFIVIFLTGEDCNECFSLPVMAMKFLICGLLIIIWTIYSTIKYLKTEGIIFDIDSEPLRETDEAVDGVPFVGEGIVEGENSKLLNSLYTNTPCVYFHSIKEKYIRSGKSGRWVIIENIALSVPFYIKDSRGKLKIDLADIDWDFSPYKIPLQNENGLYPKNSEVDCEALLRRSAWTENAGIFTMSYEKYRRSEFVLRPDTKIFACGMVLKDNEQLVLHENEKYPLIISRKNRDQYVGEFYKGGGLVYISHVLVAIGYTFFMIPLNYLLRLSSVNFLTLLSIGNFAILGSVIFSLYNRIITLQNRTFNALSNIEIDLKRRADLIPGLVEVIKKYSKYEKEIQQIIAESRAKIMFSKETSKGERPIISSLVSTIENYPELKASEQFQFLMRTLVDTENRIAYSREFYNRSVRKYNTIINQLPFLLVSSPFKMKEMDFVSIDRGENIMIDK